MRETKPDWKSFSRSSWLRRACVSRKVPAPITSGDLFHLIVVIAELQRKGQSDMLRLWWNGQWVARTDLLPSESDKSFDGWRHRVATTSKTEVALVATGLQAHSFKLWERLSKTLSPLFAKIGLPPFGLELGAFIGDYARTPIGVHRDGSEVFMWVLQGNKSMRVWNPRALSADEVSKWGRDYARLKPRSRLLKVPEQCMAYWPSTYWHVGESRGFSVSLNLAVGYKDGTPSQPLKGTVAQWAVRTITEDLVKESDRRQPVQIQARPGLVKLPATLLGVCDRSHSLFGGSQLEVLFLQDYLARVTSHGFRPGPPIYKSHLDWSRQPLVRNTLVPIAWGIAADTITISAAGHNFVTKNEPNLRQMVRLTAALSHGEQVPHKLQHRLISGHRKQLLVHLCRTGAVVPATGIDHHD